MRFLLVLLVACGGTTSRPSDPDAAVDAPVLDAPECAEADKVRVYPDADGDGFGDALHAGMLVCSEGAGQVTNNLDCSDLDPRATPGQTEKFSTPIAGQSSTGLAYDFNCDGVETITSSATIVCQNVNPNNCGSSGMAWAGEAAPGCGVTGIWVNSCQRVGGANPYCSPSGNPELIQACN